MFCTNCGQEINKEARFCESCGTSTIPASQQRPSDRPDEMPREPFDMHFHGGNDYVGRYRSGISVILLTIVTCGIYGFYWLYVTMEDINFALGERRISSGSLLLCSILCFPIMWVAFYQIDKNLAVLSREEGTRYSENFILWVVLTFLAGIGTFIAYFQVAEGLNDIWDRRGGAGARYR